MEKKKIKTKINLDKIISFRVSEKEYQKVKNILLKMNLNKSDAMRKIISKVIKNDILIINLKT